MKWIFLILLVPSVSLGSNDDLVLICKNLQGISLINEKFEKDGYSTATLFIAFFQR